MADSPHPERRHILTDDFVFLLVDHYMGLDFTGCILILNDGIIHAKVGPLRRVQLRLDLDTRIAATIVLNLAPCRLIIDAPTQVHA